MAPLARGADGATNAEVTARTSDMTKSTQLNFMLLAPYRTIVLVCCCRCYC